MRDPIYCQARITESDVLLHSFDRIDGRIMPGIRQAKRVQLVSTPSARTRKYSLNMLI
uniref:Uncharacterized protein n=1 Tax=Arundo donax TaxID=35708 RepID=A0A0A9BSY1_ARUDO